MTKPTKRPVHPAKTQISLGICPVWSESSLCAQWVAKDPWLLHVDSEDSDQTGQADLSLRLTHMPFCWLFHVVAHLYSQNTAVVILKFEQCGLPETCVQKMQTEWQAV